MIQIPEPTFFNLIKKKRDKIIKAAIAEFAQYGYSAGNLDRVVQQAGIPKGSLYQYFKNKEDLFTFIAKTALNQLWSLFQEYMDKITPRDCFEMFSYTLQFTAELKEKKSNLTLLYIRIGFMPDTPLRENILATIFSKNDMLQDKFFTWGVADGLIRRDIDKNSAKFILDAISNRFQESIFLQLKYKNKEVPDNTTKFIKNLEYFLRKAFV